MLVDAYQPEFIQKFQMIKGFFEQLKQVKIQQSINPTESMRQEESTTQRLIESNQKPKRTVYLKKKERTPPPLPQQSNQVYRASDLIMLEQHKKTIDQFCKDNQTLYDSLQDCFQVIEAMKDKIKKLEKKNTIDYESQIKKLEMNIKFKDQQLQKKSQCISEVREKYNKMIKIIEEHSLEYEKNWGELNEYNTQLEVENAFLKRMLNMQITDEQLKQLEEQQAEVEFNFFDNFCISRKELDEKAIKEYEKQLGSRKGNIEAKYIEWNLAQFQQQSQQIDELEMYGEEKEMMVKKSKQVSQEEKNRIMEELLKPIGGSKQSINFQDQDQDETVKKKQMDLLSNSTPLKKEISNNSSKSNKLEIDIDLTQQQQQLQQQNQEPEQVQPQKKSQKEEIMNSLNQGWSKLMNRNTNQSQSKRYGDVVEEEDEYCNQKTIFYDQDDYYDEDDDDEIYQQIMEQQKKAQLGNKPTLTKTQKNQELQYQN